MAQTTEISSMEDIIDVRDIVARIESLEDTEDEDEKTELARLTELMDDLAGNGGDEQWRGVWYPITLIRDSYFEDYARELADDIGAIDSKAGWPNTCIDWEQAARELQMDYTTAELDGITYWYR